MGASIRDRIQTDLHTAMKSRDVARVSVLRATLAAIANAEAVDPTEGDDRVSEVERKYLSDDDIRAIVTAEREELQSACGEMESLGQTHTAGDLAVQAAVLASYVS